MVFSFFKKQDKKMPERPAVRPRSPELLPEAKPPRPAVEAPPTPLPEPLPDLEFTSESWAASAPAASKQPEPAPQVLVHPPLKAKPVAEDVDFSIDDFDRDFTESSVMGIDVNHDDDPLQACVEQVVVLYANGQDGAARSLLETFVRSYRGSEGKRFWLLLFDLLQMTGDRAAFEKLGVDYAEACEMSPPTWSEELSSAAEQASGAVGPRKIFLQGVLTTEGAQPVMELARLVDQKVPATVDCGKLIGCDDEVAGQLADLLSRIRKYRLPVTLGGVEGILRRLDERLVAGDAAHEPAWLLLLELLQRHGTQERFEERAVDYAVTFELSPPSWEPIPASAAERAAAAAQPADDAHYLTGELKGCRFDELIAVIEAYEQPILDFSGVRRLDFISAGQLVNRLAPYKAAGRDIIIRSPHHLVAELMAVVGLNKQARIIVPKS